MGVASHSRHPEHRSRMAEIAVGLTTAETDWNTPATLTNSMLWNVDGLPQLVPHDPSDNSGEATGEMTATRVDRAGHTMSWACSTGKAQPQHLGYLLGYGLGTVATTIPTAGVYLHNIQPRNQLQLVPSTVACRYGGPTGGTISRRFASACVNSWTINFGESYLSASGDILGTGYFTSDLVEEAVSALDNVTSVTLAANGIYGDDAAARLDALHQIQTDFSDTNDYYRENVVCSAVSDASPAVLTITSLGGAGGTVNYRVLYRTDTDVAWVTFPARVDTDPFRIGNMTLTVNGDWDGSSYNEGATLGCDVQDLSITWNNNAAPRFCMTGSGDYADMVQAGDADLSITMTRELWDWWFNQVGYKSPRSTSLYIKCQQSTAITSTYYPYLEMVLPKIGIIGEPVTASDGRLVVGLDIKGLSHSTYGPIICNLQDTVTGYAA